MAIIDIKSIMLPGIFLLGKVTPSGPGEVIFVDIDTYQYKLDTTSGLTFVPRIFYAADPTVESCIIGGILESDTSGSGYVLIDDNRLTKPYSETLNNVIVTPQTSASYLNGVGVIGIFKQFIRVSLTLTGDSSQPVYCGITAILSPSLSPVNVDYYNN